VLDGAVHASLTLASPATAGLRGGAAGKPRGVADSELERGPSPTPLNAAMKYS
jgi:hypothetical protein